MFQDVPFIYVTKTLLSLCMCSSTVTIQNNEIMLPGNVLRLSNLETRLSRGAPKYILQHV